MVYGGVGRGAAALLAAGDSRARARPIPAIAAVARVTEEGGGHYRLLLADGTPAHEVLAALVAHGAAVERFEPLLAPMEDIFVRVVREGRA